jgi:hypothetical protein
MHPQYCNAASQTKLAHTGSVFSYTSTNQIAVSLLVIECPMNSLATMNAVLAHDSLCCADLGESASEFDCQFKGQR